MNECTEDVGHCWKNFIVHRSHNCCYCGDPNTSPSVPDRPADEDDRP